MSVKLKPTASFWLGRRSFASTSGAVPLSFVTYGDPRIDRRRPPLVIAHGLFGQKQNWSSVSKALQRRLGNVVYALDLRNHGESPWTPTSTYEDMALDLEQFLVKTASQDGWEKFSLLGHSMGGKAAMKVATHDAVSNLLDALIVEDVAPKAYFDSHKHFPVYIAAMKAAKLKGRTRQEIGEELSKSVPDVATRQFLLTNLAVDGDGFRWKMNLEALERNLPAILGFNLSIFSRFTRPTLFLYGECSGYVTSADRPEILRHFPLTTFRSVSNAGHWVHADNPKQFADVLVEFLSSV